VLFNDRADAGQQLADRLRPVDLPAGSVVLGLARGGVPIAAAVARSLDLPLDVLVVRKIGMPGNPEFAIGALGANCLVLNEELIAQAGIARHDVDRVVATETAELRRREDLYRRGRGPAVELDGKTVVVVDDGLATGSTMAVALQQVRAARPARLISAVPVASPQAVARIEELADLTVVVQVEEDFGSVGRWYLDFDQTSDDQVVSCLTGDQ